METYSKDALDTYEKEISGFKFNFDGEFPKSRENFDQAEKDLNSLKEAAKQAIQALHSQEADRIAAEKLKKEEEEAAEKLRLEQEEAERLRLEKEA